MIRIFRDYESLSRAAADFIAEQSQKTVRNRGQLYLALSGGRTPRLAYELLSLDSLLNKIPWSKVNLFWSDERCVPPDDPRSNERMARKAFIDRVPIPAGQVHPLRCAGSPQQSAKKYEALLKSFFPDDARSFDILLLGLGEDGHTASLFPASEVLNETKRWAREIHRPQEDFYRITLTLPLINRASQIIFLASGKQKAKALARVMDRSADVPARLVRPINGQLLWLVDQEAASELQAADLGIQ
jgi:6-phosphogluconolactonase